MSMLYHDNNHMKAKRIGQIITAITVLLLLADGIAHLIQIPLVVNASVAIGFSADSVVQIGIIEIICVLLYAIPRTSVFGAILLTGYLGGAVAINFYARYSLFAHILFPVYVGIFAWAGLYLRNERLRSIFFT